MPIPGLILNAAVYRGIDFDPTTPTEWHGRVFALTDSVGRSLTLRDTARRVPPGESEGEDDIDPVVSRMFRVIDVSFLDHGIAIDGVELDDSGGYVPLQWLLTAMTRDELRDFMDQ